MTTKAKKTRQKPDPVVRPKASMRKGRSSTIDHTARRPLQDRSMQRFESILTAVEELLQTANIEDISFYDIARQAKISPASINYLFPTMAALRIELTKRYMRISSENVVETQRALAKMRNPSWQDWMFVMGRQARDHFHAHRHVSEVCLGPQLHRESRRANIAENDTVGRSLLESFRQVFIFPDIPGLELKFALMMEIVDALWSRSYVATGRIEDDVFEESIRIQIAYLRTILPETLPLVRAGTSADTARGSGRGV